MKRIFRLLFLFFALLHVRIDAQLIPEAPTGLEIVEAALRLAHPECPYTGHDYCNDGIDNDMDNVVDEVAPSASISSDGAGNYRLEFEDCQLVGGYTTETDANFESGDRVTKPAGTAYYDGEIACAGSLSAGTYYLHIYASSPGGQRAIWVKTGTTLGRYPNNATEATIFPQVGTPQWIPISATGSNVNFQNKVNGGSRMSFVHAGGNVAFFFKAEEGVRFGCAYLSTSQTPSPSCPGGTGSGTTVNYEIYELGAASVPTDWNSAAFDNANVMTFQGFDNSNLTCTVKILWDNNTTDRGYLSANCNDTDDDTLGISSDASNFHGALHDYLSFRWRGDLSQLLDTNTYIVTGALNDIYWDGDWSGTNNVQNSAVNLSTTVNGTVNAGVSWTLFLAFDLGSNIAPDTLGICNLGIKDVDAAAVTGLKFFFGTNSNALNDASQFGVCKFSNTAVPGAADVTAPTVSNPSIPAGTVERTSLIVTADTNEDGTCRVRYGTSTGVYTFTTAGVLSVNLKCNVTVTGLDANTTYFADMQVCDPAGNCGDSSEVSATTDAEAPTGGCDYFASNTGTGNGLSDSTPFKISNFWAVAGPGKKLCLLDGTFTGSTGMITPPAGLSGTSAAPITISAINDGEVLIDGQNARLTFSLTNNDWWVFEGFNVRNSNGVVVLLRTGADHNTLKRIVAWKEYAGAVSPASAIIGCFDNTGNTFEDIAAFGSSRKTYGPTQGCDNSVHRRIWAQYSSAGPTDSQPRTSIEISYNSYNVICENCIATWDAINNVGEEIGGLASGAPSVNVGGSVCVNNKYIASMAYIRSVDTVFSLPGTVFGSRTVDCFHFIDTTVIVESHPTVRPLLLQVYDGGGSTPCCGNPANAPFSDRVLRNTTEIGGSASSISLHATNGWEVINRSDTDTVSASNSAGANPFQTSAGTGARMCFRTVNGKLTSTKLWPWPMDSRINAAITDAGYDPADFFRGSGNTITSEVETLWGTSIPAGCKS